MLAFADLEDRLTVWVDAVLDAALAPIPVAQGRDTTALTIPRVLHSVIVTTEGENESVTRMQFDVFHTSRLGAYAARRTLLDTIHANTPREVTADGLMLYTVWASGERVPDPDVNVTHLRIDLDFHVMRQSEPLAS